MMDEKDINFAHFLAVLNTLETGYHTGYFSGRCYSLSIERPVNGRVTKVYASELGGPDFISFNLFKNRKGKPILKPCEMAEEKVINFVVGFNTDTKTVFSSINDEKTTNQSMV